MDNAIEECQRLEAKDRIIAVELKQKNDMVVYAVDNPCLPDPAKKKGHIHGYGLSNVRNCIAKYNGTISTEKNNGRYQVVIRLNVSDVKIATKG